MSASDIFENKILALIFNGTTFAALADNTATTPATVFYVSLHTADPGDVGNQSTNEATYTSYARVSVVRTTAGWTVTGSTVANAGQITFPECTGGTSTVTHFGIGLSATGTGTLLFSAALNSSLIVNNGITPAFNVGTLTVVAD